MPIARIDFLYRGDVETHQVLCRDIKGIMLSFGCLQGYVVTFSGCVTTWKAVLGFLNSAPYVATSYAPCCNLATNIELLCLLMVSCTLIKCISLPLGLFRP
ncbi:hypothetical protein PVK06_047569 [Gossypium arboreum]|uniref:Uncharacterized protein n=1 Tax=Gossypium arboreum TaxID=29729 RepID=A0ABR0ME38_GOSAR|nr:hypothetical protein PVK06_047569 [Gossypium arboreum]